jgi:hypothetical protein
MAEFVFLFRSSPQAQQAAMGTPEQAQQSLQRWLAWVHSLEENGYLKSRGQPLDRGGKVVRGATVTDGPYVEAKDMVLGFNIIEARDLEHAAQIAAGCPIAQAGGAVEVRPIMAMPV